MYDGAIDAVNLSESYVDGTEENEFIHSSCPSQISATNTLLCVFGKDFLIFIAEFEILQFFQKTLSHVHVRPCSSHGSNTHCTCLVFETGHKECVDKTLFGVAERTC